MHPSSPISSSTSSPRRSLKLRDGETDDARVIEAVHYESREAVYAGRVADWPPPGPDRVGRIRRWERWLGDPTISCLVGELSGRVVAFSTIRPSADSDAGPATAEMPTLYVRPDEWRKGYGRAVCAAALDRAAARGFDELTLWVLEINQEAAAFYEAVGFSFDGATKVDELPHERLLARRYRIALDADRPST